jgi:hypothetical protein
MLPGSPHEGDSREGLFTSTPWGTRTLRFGEPSFETCTLVQEVMMAAAEGSSGRQAAGGKLKAHLVATPTTMYAGSLACHHASGYLKPGADTATFKFRGRR